MVTLLYLALKSLYIHLTLECFLLTVIWKSSLEQRSVFLIIITIQICTISLSKREKGIDLQDTYNFLHMYQVLIRFLRDEQPVFRYDLLRYQDENVAKEKEELISNLKKHGITKKMITRLA